MNRVVVRLIGTRICIWCTPPPPTRMLYGKTSGCPTFQSSFSSVAPLSTRRLMIPHSNGVKPILMCSLPNDAGAVKPSWRPMNSK